LVLMYWLTASWINGTDCIGPANAVSQTNSQITLKFLIFIAVAIFLTFARIQHETYQ